MSPRAHFDDIIRSSMNPGKLDYLKHQELMMTEPPKHRPKVMMEPDKKEMDYPHTRKYEYDRPKKGKEAAKDYLDELMRDSDPQQKKIPRTELPRSKRVRRNIADTPTPKSESLGDAHKRIMEDLRVGAFDALSIYKGQNNPGKPTGKKN